MPENPFNTQVGGSHYKQYAIQPYEFFFKNNIPHHKAAIIRRILRYDHETGKGKEDLEKIKHEVDLILTLEYPTTPTNKEPNNNASNNIATTTYCTCATCAKYSNINPIEGTLDARAIDQRTAFIHGRG